MDAQSSESVDALGRMSRQIYDEYRNLKYAGVTVEPSRFLALREQTQNHRYTQLVVADAGIFFMDTTRKARFKLHPGLLFVYYDGLSPEDEAKLKDSENSLVLLDNGLEFWKRYGSGPCLVADQTNHCDYLPREFKDELQRVRAIQKKSDLVINPMLHKKANDQPDKKPTGAFLIDLDD